DIPNPFTKEIAKLFDAADTAEARHGDCFGEWGLNEYLEIKAALKKNIMMMCPRMMLCVAREGLMRSLGIFCRGIRILG
mgnify:CR=1